MKIRIAKESLVEFTLQLLISFEQRPVYTKDLPVPSMYSLTTATGQLSVQVSVTQVSR